MVDTIGASTSLVGHHLLYQRPCCKDDNFKRRTGSCRLLVTEFMGQRLPIGPSTSVVTPRQRYNGFVDSTVKSMAMELTKEKNPSKEDWRRIARDLGYTSDTAGVSPGRLWPPANKADDPMIHNPLLRQERMGCGWFAVIFEMEGVIVEDDSELQRQAWLVLSREEGRSPPFAFVLKRIEGMKNEQAISEVLCWSRDPTELRRLASRKEEIYRSLKNGGYYQLRSGSQELMTTLANHKIPLAVASTRPRKVLQEAVEGVGVQSFLDVIVAAEDVFRGKPDPEMFLYAAQLLNFIPQRCIVFGNSNSTVEAAHDARMKCVAVASKHPVYELRAADLVVRQLDELSVVDLKNLADIDSPEFESGEPEVEMEEEEDDPSPSCSVGVDDLFW
ncbi:5-amino-6-(5-phospho-D-ribitylamino)uracil phosphatase, chloroplastic isoform X1 [Musa acuminata AAA Group]|uniref:5-amino-6-(5-phospho-D-ribitylamino)uracil phosphatase, chloroplastic isoform X1 n=2 Tax=Musa acuminata AAA Group TaxID=214697 RepID=UPI0031D3A5CD